MSSSSVKSPPLGEFIALMALMTSLVALSIDAVLPALGQISQAIALQNPEDAYLLVSLFFFGTACGQLVFGPVADAYGRRTVILLGLIIFCIGSLICMFANDLTSMLIGRVVQAFGVSGPRVATLAVIRDKYAGEAMARVMSFIMMVFILVPMIAPLIGQAIMLLAGWVHIFTFFMLFGGTVGVWFFVRQGETLTAQTRIPIRLSNLKTSLWFVVSHRSVMGYTLASGFIFGSFLAYISSSQAILQQWYATGEWFPLYFAMLAFGVGLASFTNGRLVMKLGMQRLANLALRGLLLFSGMLWAASDYYQGMPPLWLFIGLMFGCFFFTGILFGNLGAMAMQPLGHMAGFGGALFNSLSGFMSVGLAVLIGRFVQTDVLPIAIGFVLCTLGAIICFAFARGQQPDNH